MAPSLTIGQVAKTSGVAAKTIRYYEEIGVLPTPRRTTSGYRLYDQTGVERLRFIRRARQHASDHEKIPPGKCGSRMIAENREAVEIDFAFKERLVSSAHRFR